MTRVNKRKSTSTRRRALLRQRERNSERISQGEAVDLRIIQLGDWEYRTHLAWFRL
jgi:hypothetical protein